MGTQPGLKSFDEIGREMGLSVCRVNQIYQRAMKKLKFWAERDPELLAAFDMVLRPPPKAPSLHSRRESR